MTIRRSLALALPLLLGAASLSAQTPAPPAALEQVRALGLDSLAGDLPVHHRPADRARAAEVQAILRQAAAFYADSLGLATRVHVALLGPPDWERVSPIPYGVPYVRGGVVFLPATGDGVIVDDFLALQAGASPAVHALVAGSGRSFAENARMMTDLIGYHELGHTYSTQMGIRPHARWFSE